MRLVILHVGDAHIKDESAIILTRAEQIVDAARLVEPAPTLCIVAVAGDLAFSGLTTQFVQGRAFVEQLRAHVIDAWKESNAEVHVVAVPGNHDCDLATPLPVRDELIKAIAKNPALAGEEQAVAVCTRPLDAFFEFRDACAADGLAEGADRLLWMHRFETDAGEIWIRCLNSAWLSQRPETVGSKVFPEDKIDDLGADCSLVVSLLHHPLNWLQPMNARAVRQRLQQTSDVILTGHEHLFAARSQQDQDGQFTLYLEGLALQDPGGEECGFHVLAIDTTTRQFRIVPFQWDGVAFKEQSGPFVDWSALGAQPLKGTGNLRVSTSFATQLRDPGIALRHPAHGLLALDDIFVFPDLREVTQDPAPHQPKIFTSAKLFELSAKHPRILVTGARESGRTCLAKRMFVDCVESGLVPLLLDGRTTRLRGDALRDRKELSRVFEDQYTAEKTEFASLGREKVVLLLDNYQALSISDAPEVLKALSHIAARVVLFSHDFVQHVHDLVSATARRDGVPEVAHYAIMPYGHVRREELIERYVRLAAPADRDKAEVLRSDMRHLLNTALGKYYAPPVPVAIVSILQARAFQDDLNLSKSTYGYYYELLVKRSLMVAAMPGEVDVSFGYLTEMARALFLEGKNEWDEAWFMKFHDSFNIKTALTLRYSDVHAALVDRGLFSGTPARYEFQYGYVYYYFVARALAEDLASTEGKERVRELTTKLDQEEAANVLLFLTHLSKDASVIDPMLEQANKVFSEAAIATLEVQEADLPDLEEALRGAILEDRPIALARGEFLESLDAAARIQPVNNPTASAHADDQAARMERSADAAGLEALTSRMYAAFRTMQILGQLLKNFPGTLDAEKKMRVARTTYAVGLRVLGALQELLRERTDETVRGIVELLREQHPSMKNEKVLDRARMSVSYLTFVAAYGTTQRIASSVGTPLLQPIYERIQDEWTTPAVQLITAALSLDRYDQFPEGRILDLAREYAKNPLALRVLRGLVITHFHLFEEDREIRQRVCEALKIEFRPLAPQIQQRTRLLS